jgi:hypothetical protein
MTTVKPPRLSWTPKPAEWPAIPNFDGSVTSETQWGTYGVQAIGDGVFEARFRPLGSDDWIRLPQVGQSRDDAYKSGVLPHYHDMWDSPVPPSDNGG